VVGRVNRASSCENMPSRRFFRQGRQIADVVRAGNRRACAYVVGRVPVNDRRSLPAGFSLRAARPDELSALAELDDAACILFEQAGMTFSFSSEHPFVQDELARWRRALERGAGRVVVGPEAELVAFAIYGDVDGLAYLDQLSVHPAFQRRGLGETLVRECVAWAGGRNVWLTTYAHLPWNGPYYRRLGFEVVPEEKCSPELRAVLASQRAALPLPEQRIAMVRPASGRG